MEQQRKVLQEGFVGRGRIECDGKEHYMVREDYKAHNCKQETHVGPCSCPKPAIEIKGN